MGKISKRISELGYICPPVDNYFADKFAVMRFLGNVLAVIVGLFLFFALSFFMLILIAAIAGSGSGEVKIKSRSVLELDLSGVRLDYAGKSIYKEFDYAEVGHDGVSDMIRAIEKAADDERIHGISILNNFSQLGQAQTKAVRDALIEFRKSGKFVYSYASVYTQNDYYLNSAADSVYINPVGMFDFKGLSSEVLFFKGLQEKSGIDIEVVRHGKYKSAVEPFLQNSMSEANREQITQLLQSVWEAMANDISASRNIPVARLDSIASGLYARTPEMALREKLVDVVGYEDQYNDMIRKRLGVGADKKFNRVKIRDYAEKIGSSAGDYSKEKIAVIYAQGEILSGEGSENYIGEGSMRRALREVRRDKNVKAVVLRVDSPGGSALTSELIWREIELTKKTKPVVVSMGNLAASGGYYIACGGNRIFAEANTITGSIGVFGMLPNFTNLSRRIGINAEQVSTHKNAAGYSPFSPVDPAMRGYIQQEVERIYTTFVSRVAQGRKMPVAKVDSIAQGRVWTGKQALDNGLVDEIGGLDQAIAEAAKLAKIKKYRIANYPEYEKNFRDLLAGLGLPFMSTESMIEKEIGAESYQILKKAKAATQRSGVQAWMPFELVVR